MTGPVDELLGSRKPGRLRPIHLGRDLVRIFVVMIDLKNRLIRIRNPDRKYVKRSTNRIITSENKVPIFFSTEK